MKRTWILIILLTSMLPSLLTLTACTAPTPSPSPTSTATVTPAPTATTIPPTKTPSPTPTATPLYEPLEGPHYREISRYDLKERIRQSELSPDGSMLAVLTFDGVYLYDADTLELRWLHQMPTEGPPKITWTADNELLFLYSTVPDLLINLEDGSILKEINYESDNDKSRPSPNGKYFFTYDVDNVFPIYDAGTHELLLTLSGSYQSSFPTWMPDGEHVIFYPGEGSLEIWDVEHGEMVQELENLYQWDKGLRETGFSPDERYFVYTGFINDTQNEGYLFCVMVWDLSTGEPLTVDELDGSPSDHDWQLDEQTFVFNSGLVIRINGLVAETIMLYEEISISRDVYERPDGLLIVWIDAILRYDEDFTLIATTTGHTSAGSGNTNNTLSPDGQMLAIGVLTRYYVWDIEQNELVIATTELEGYRGAGAAWSAGSDMLAIGDHARRQVTIWDANSRSVQKTIYIDSHICAIAWVDDSTLGLALTEEHTTMSDGGCVMQFLAILDIETEQIIYREQQSAHFFDFISLYDQRHIAFTKWPDSYAEETESSSTLVIWDSQTNQRSYTTEIDQWDRIHWLQNASGVVISETESLRVINLETGEESVIDQSGYLLGDYILDYDWDNFKLSWYDLDGNHLETGGFEFWPYVAGDPIITADGRIFDAVSPSRWEPDVALIELFPPEQ